jgi:excinuclease ABC subunit C
VTAPALESVALADGVDAALARIPPSPGVGQILAAGGHSLVIGRASNLRRWAAGHLGRARLPKAVPGKLPPRPPTDLTPIAVAVAYATTTSPFGQRLAFERLMAGHVPLSKRRDLKRPAYLRLDLDERFPRLAVQPSPAGAHVFGPFRDAKAAGKARDALYRRFRLRPCDFEFEPAADLALGLGCMLAQVENCAAPCLQRVSVDGYRAIAAEAARALE